MARRAALALSLMLTTLTLSGGLALAATISCEAGPDCLGTRQSDTLRGTESTDLIFGRNGSDVIRGRGGDDRIFGERGDDSLFAGAGDYNYLTGGFGDDELVGGAGTDLYYFGNGWGDDTVRDGTSDNRALFYGPDDVPVGEDLIVRFSPGPGAEAKTKDGQYRVSWEGDPFNYVVGGSGDDSITGDDDDFSRIVPGDGDDDVFAGGGHDDILAHGDGGGDTIECGPGNDTVYYDLFDQVASNCEEKHLTTQLPNP
jgi:Ca2+-binding RTX toxin-like protein